MSFHWMKKKMINSATLTQKTNSQGSRRAEDFHPYIKINFLRDNGFSIHPSTAVCCSVRGALAVQSLIW